MKLAHYTNIGLAFKQSCPFAPQKMEKVAKFAGNSYLSHKLAAPTMFKSILRLLGLFSLALAVITAVLDVTRTIADSAPVITPLGTDWFNFSPSSLNLSQAIIQRYVHPVLWDPVFVKILLMPSWSVFAVLAALLLWFGKPRERRWQNRFGK